MKEKLLIVEDDRVLAEMIGSFLADEGFQTRLICDGIQAVEMILQDPPDLVILDVMLPGMNGTEVCQAIRPDYRGSVLMLTARDDEITEINALNRGADGYLTKPVRPHILLAHIKAILRKSKRIDTEQADVAIMGLHINRSSMEVLLDGVTLDLSTAEYQLLSYLLQNSGKILSRDNLYRELRGIEYDGIDRAMDMRISTLREKLHDTRPPYRFIKTVRNRGYLFAADKS